MKGNGVWEIPLDLIQPWLDLKWVIWWLGERLIVSWWAWSIVPTKMLQDLTIIDFVRWLMNADQTCECMCGDASHSWHRWPQLRFRELIWMMNWWPRLGVLMKFCASVLTVESQLVGILTQRTALVTIENNSCTFDCYHRPCWTQYAWAHNLLQYLVQGGTEDRMPSTIAVRVQIPGWIVM